METSDGYSSQKNRPFGGKAILAFDPKNAVLVVRSTSPGRKKFYKVRGERVG